MIEIKATKTEGGGYLVETCIPGAPKEFLEHKCPTWELTCAYIEGFMEMIDKVISLEAKIIVRGEANG